MDDHGFDFKTATLKVLRNPEDRTLAHFPDENGDAYCDTDEDLEPEDHPVVNAGVWCAQCIKRMFADTHDVEGGMEGEDENS